MNWVLIKEYSTHTRHFCFPLKLPLVFPVSIFLISLCTNGCVGIDPDSGFREVKTIITDKTSFQTEWRKSSEDDERVSRSITALLSDGLTVDEATQIALSNNPDLQATYEKLGIAQADFVQAGLLKNPIFGADIHFVGKGIGVGSNLNVFQDFIDILQQPLRKKMAEAEFNRIKLEVAYSAFEIASETREAFYALQGEEELLKFKKTIAQGLETLLEMARRQHKAGNISDLDFALEEGAFSRAKLELEEAKLQVFDKREKLNLLLGVIQSKTHWTIPSKLPDAQNDDEAVEKLEQIAIDNRLDLQAARLEIESLAKRFDIVDWYRLIPELKLGIDLEGERESKIVPGPNVELALPIFDQGEAKVAEVQALIRQAQKKYLALGLKIRFEVRSAYNHLIAARSQTTFAKQSLLPTSKRALQEMQLQYNSMLVGLDDLFAVKKAEVEAENAYVSSLTNYWISRSKLEHAIGRSLSTIKEK